MKRLWFRAKNYGWGWYPITWQGWFITFAFAGFSAGGAIAFSKLLELDPEDALLLTCSFLLWTGLNIMLIIAICYKTGEKPSWRWGSKK